LQIEKDGGDIAGFVGCQVKVRSLGGSVKFAGEMINYDSKNGIVTVATEQGNRDAILCEAFVTGLWNIYALNHNVRKILIHKLEKS
jgi:hypothetical protein